MAERPCIRAEDLSFVILPQRGTWAGTCARALSRGSHPDCRATLPAAPLLPPEVWVAGPAPGQGEMGEIVAASLKIKG